MPVTLGNQRVMNSQNSAGLQNLQQWLSALILSPSPSPIIIIIIVIIITMIVQRPPQQLTTTLPPAANADSMKSPVACKSYHFWVPHEKYIIWVPHQPSQSTHFLLILVFFAMPWSRHTALYVTGSWNIGNKLAGPWNIGQCQHRQNHCTGSQSSWDLDNYHYHNWNQQNYSSSEVRLLGGPPSSS